MRVPAATSTPTRRRPSSPEAVDDGPERRSSASRWASCWRSCRGTSRSGRCSASPRRRSWPATRRSSSTPPTCRGCALAIEDVFRERRLPGGLFATVLVGPAPAPRRSSPTRASRAVTLTGSERRGHEPSPRRPGATLKKTVLELGGSDPFIVLADADLDAAAQRRPRRRACMNSGQSCIAAKRFIVVEAVAEEFVGAVRRRAARALEVGDPLDPRHAGRPAGARRPARRHCTGRSSESVARGRAARCSAGELRRGKGCFYPPTLLAGVAPGMPAFDEETFGPVARRDPRQRRGRRRRGWPTTRRSGSAPRCGRSDRARAERLAGEIEAGACSSTAW